jgi:hypothetical protein
MAKQRRIKVITVAVREVVVEITPQMVLDKITPGTRVTILIPNGKSLERDSSGRSTGKIIQDWKEATGRAVIVTRHNFNGPVSHVALNMGGRFGTPGVATVENLVGIGKLRVTDPPPKGS